MEEEEWTINRIYNKCTDLSDPPKVRWKIANQLYNEYIITGNYEKLEDIAHDKALWRDYQDNFVSRYGDGKPAIEKLRNLIDRKVNKDK